MGALMQLAAYGAQDAYLTGNPQMTYRKENFVSSGFSLKRAAIGTAIAVSLAIISFYMTRDIGLSLSLFLLVAIGVIFVSL